MRSGSATPDHGVFVIKIPTVEIRCRMQLCELSAVYNGFSGRQEPENYHESERLSLPERRNR